MTVVFELEGHLITTPIKRWTFSRDGLVLTDSKGNKVCVLMSKEEIEELLDEVAEAQE